MPRPLWEWLLDYFFTKVRPHIMPVMIRSYSRFSTLADSPMYLAVEMGKSGRKGREAHALIEIPTTVLPRPVRQASTRRLSHPSPPGAPDAPIFVTGQFLLRPAGERA